MRGLTEHARCMYLSIFGNGSRFAPRRGAMTDRPAEPTFDPFRDELVTFLAQRLGVSPEVALSTLGDWLLNFEATDQRLERARRRL